MNALIVGTRKEIILDHLPTNFLLIDDGSVIDALEFGSRRAVTHFDISKHAFNPLKDMDYKRARDFVSVLNAIFPEGESTLTRKNANFALLQTFIARQRRLDRIEYVADGASKEGILDATQKIQTLLLSPVLRNVLTRPTNFSFKRTILARLDRALIGDFDCFVLANLLISIYGGPVVIPDFGFYHCSFHSSLLRQGRLVVGINSFDEVPAFKNQLLLVNTKIGSHCTAEDAALLAAYEGLTPGTNAFTSFVHACIAAQP